MSENNISNCADVSDGESTEEEIEPKLKYVRMLNNLKNCLQTETASCIAVHPKFVCLGTSWGMVHLFDHQGNSIHATELKKHSVAVNTISIDSRGEYVASCSDDGYIHVNDLYGDTDSSFTINAGRHVGCICIESNNGGSGNNRTKCRIISGDNRLTLHEKVYSMLGLARIKSTVLCESEGPVGAIAWQGQFVAWSSVVGVRVYDVNDRRSMGLIRWERPVMEEDGDNECRNSQSTSALDEFRCNLRWADDRTLLIGWADTVRVCLIRRRGTTAATVVNAKGISGEISELPEHQVDPISTFRTDFFISGIAPLDQQLVLLGVPRNATPGARPQLHIVEYRDCEYSEICMDSLSLRGYTSYTCSDYHLDVLTEENRFFIVAPKDVVVASPCDLDDRVHWLVHHGKYEQAMEAVQTGTQHHPNQGSDDNSKSTGQHHTTLSVGIAYLDHLLAIGEYDQAGRLCLRLFGNDADLWHSHIYKFARARRLPAISAYLPRTLGPHVYEMVLYDYLKTDAVGFLALVREWNQPGLYNTGAVISAVLEHIIVCDVESEKPAVKEALAVLYGYAGRYEKAISMYLKLGHSAVFDMIHNNKLYEFICPMIVDLMKLDEDKTVDLLINAREKIPPAMVVETLSGSHNIHLYKYLDELDKKYTRECGAYHGLMVNLYSIYCREKLLPFLKRSEQYPIQAALEICQQKCYYREIVFLLGRVGDTREALALIIGQLGDVKHALEFCQEHNDAELWIYLMQHSANLPEFIKFLLPRIAGYIDPRELVDRIKPGLKITGLRDALIRMLRQYNLQASIQEGFKKILVADYFALHERLVRSSQRGLYIGDELLCGACHHKVLTASNDTTKASDLVTYNCRHTFHEQCLSRPIQPTCAICSPSGDKCIDS